MTSPVALNRGSADRTSVVLLEPLADTISVKPVLTGQHGSLVAKRHLVHADGAFAFELGPKHLFVELLPRKVPNRLL